MCKACVDKELKNVRSLISKIGKKDLIVLMKDYNLGYLKLAEEFNGFRDKVYQIKENAYSVGDLSHTPSVSIVNELGQVVTANHAIKSTNLNFELFEEIIIKTYARPISN